MEKTEPLKLEALKFKSNELVILANVSVKYDDQVVNEPISFIVEQGDRIVLDGKNGSGKSSILKLILGQSIQYTGLVTLGTGLTISYVQQDTSHLKGSLSDYIEEQKLMRRYLNPSYERWTLTEFNLKRYISLFWWTKEKLLIAKSLCEKAHLYIWDEPLNFIDIYSRMQIEELIQQFNPTMIIVEHDKAFQQTVATKTISM